jgi:hypothetical protein
MTKRKTGIDLGIKPFLCHKCGKEAVFFDTDKNWYCGIIVGFGNMNSKTYNYSTVPVFICIKKLVLWNNCRFW